MNRQYFYIILTIFLFTSCRKDTGSSNPVLEQMCQRLFPQHADSFEFELLNDSNQMDRFILESAHKKICIKGNNNNSLAVGLNHYLNITAIRMYLGMPLIALICPKSYQ